MRPTEEELSAMSPEFDHRWSTYFANAPDKPVIVVVPIAWWVYFNSRKLHRDLICTRLFISYAGNSPDVPRGKYFSVGYFSVGVFLRFQIFYDLYS